MTCPKCGHQQSEGWLSCQKCHIIFSRWQGTPTAVQEAPAAGQPAPPTATVQTPRPPTLFGDRPPEPARPVVPVAPPVAAAPRPAGWWVYLALLLPFAVGLWWLLNPRGLAIQPGSFHDPQKQFAIRAPEGWLTLTRENYDAIIRQYGSQLPSDYRKAMSGSNVEVSFVRLGVPAEFAPTMNIVLVKQALHDQ